LLTGCATGISEQRIATLCPPVVGYGREFRARRAEELDLLPKSSAIAEMLVHTAVMRERARRCALEPNNRTHFLGQAARRQILCRDLLLQAAH